MVNMVLRGAVLLWAAFFAIVGARGLLDPASYTETFGFTISGVAINTLRADLSSFFLVSAGAAALYGTALAGRLFGVAVGDPTNFGIVQGMIVEALSVLLMLGSWWALSRPAAGPAQGSADTAH